MFSKNVSKRATLVVTAVSAVIALTIAISGASAASNCQKIEGKFSVQPVTGPACTSPIGLCGIGRFIGGLQADSELTGTSLIETMDTPTTEVVVITADNVFHTNKGDLITKPVFALSTAEDVAVLDTVIGGTDGWAGATGFIKGIGTFSPASGGEGDYIGEICTP